MHVPTPRPAARRRAGFTAGFTLVEIMIVVLIIGILLNIATPSFIAARETSRCRACIANLNQIDGAVQQYAIDYKLTVYPASSQATIGAAFPRLTAYLRTAPSCPSNGFYNTGDSTTAATTATTGRPSCATASGGATPEGIGKNVHQLP